MCAVIDEKDEVTPEDLDRYDLLEEEDASGSPLMYDELLPFATGAGLRTATRGRRGSGRVG